MRSVPADLLAKLYEKMQTKGMNADPRIYLVFHRSERYIEEGGLLAPQNVLTTPPATDLGSWDMALRRDPELYKTYPSHIYRAHVDNGSAEVTRIAYDNMLNAMTNDEVEVDDLSWEDLSWTIADVVEVAIEFDGYWVRTAKDAVICFDSLANWTHVTEGEPWVFWVDSAGALKAQQGAGGSELTLAADNVTKISAIRGWKSVATGHQDQGLIIGYIRSGTLRYRNYAEQDTEPATWMWESEKIPEIDALPVSAVNLGLARTNDYRTAFIYENGDGEIHWLVTIRRWAGMGIPAESVSAQLLGINAVMSGIHYIVIGEGPYPNASTPPYSSHQHQKPGGLIKTEAVSGKLEGVKGVLLYAGEEFFVKSVENVPVVSTSTGEDLVPDVGDGVTKEFNLVWLPDTDTETLYIDGITQVRGTDYTIDGRNITFSVAPSVGLPLTADYEWTNWGTQIKMLVSVGVTEVSVGGWSVEDDLEGITVGAVSIAEVREEWKIHDDYPYQGVLLSTADFNGEGRGDIKVEYDGSTATLKGDIGQALTTSISVQFTPVNLQTPMLPAPEVEVMWNE